MNNRKARRLFTVRTASGPCLGRWVGRGEAERIAALWLAGGVVARVACNLDGEG